MIMKYTTAREILIKGSELRNKQFKDLGNIHRLKSLGNKGGLGHVIEEEHFGYQINSNRLPDFNEANIELKVTPIRKNKNGSYSAKERLVLNIIDFHTEYKQTFETSSFWTKNQTLFLVFYLFEEALERWDYTIEEVFLFDYPEEDLEIIKKDWHYIIKMIKDGRAHELSESQTMYLGACPKGATKATSMLEQPFSNEPAMRRAFSLKQSYMTQIIRDYVSGNKTHPQIIKSPQQLDSPFKKASPSKDESILTDIKALKEKAFEQIIEEKLAPYIDTSIQTLKHHFNIEHHPKNLNMILLNRMLGLKGNIRKTTEFKKANITPKTIRINQNNHIVENMSFPAFRFKDIIGENWEDSTFKNTLESQKFMFVIFKESENTTYFKGVQFWSMPVKDIEYYVKPVWEKTKQIIKEGNIVQSVDSKGKRKTNFPSSKDNRVSHVRPHAQTTKDTHPLPVADAKTQLQEYTKHCFWLNNTYILAQLDKRYFQ